MSGEHGFDLVDVDDPIVLHTVCEPLVAVRLDQRVSPGDPASVQGDDHLAFVGGVGGFFSGVTELLGVIGAGIPDDHLSRAILALRYDTFEGGVFQGVILGAHGQVVHRRGFGEVFRHRPRHQHAVVLQPEVVVQASGVMLLDDERVALPRGWFHRGHRLRGFRRVALAAVCAQSIAGRRPGVRRVHRCNQVSVGRDPGEDLVITQLTQPGISKFLPGAGRGDGRLLTTPQRVGRDGGLRPAVLTPVKEYLARPQAFGHGRRHQRRHRLLQLLRNPFRQQRRTLAAGWPVQRRIQVQSLAAAGQRVGDQADLGDHVPDGVGHFAELRHGHALARVQVEHQPGRRAGRELGSVAAGSPGDESPLRYVNLERGLLGDPCEAVEALFFAETQVEQDSAIVDAGDAGAKFVQARRLVHIETSGG